MDWQPIDTAPRDGSTVLAWRADWERPSFVRWALSARTGTGCWNDADRSDGCSLEEEPPTHWLRLPPLPQAD